MTIKVTQKHIDEGNRGTCTLCPVALAIRDQLYSGMTVLVGTNEIDIAYQGQWSSKSTIKTPMKVSDFIDKFDCGEPVEPFEFSIPYPYAS